VPFSVELHCARIPALQKRLILDIAETDCKE
jgi:hypothetical protein